MLREASNLALQVSLAGPLRHCAGPAQRAAPRERRRRGDRALPGGARATARFEKAKAELRMALADAAPNGLVATRTTGRFEAVGCAKIYRIIAGVLKRPRAVG
jgi:hypothetical protein